MKLTAIPGSLRARKGQNPEKLGVITQFALWVHMIF